MTQFFLTFVVGLLALGAAEAGQVRKLELSEDRPATVVLARGRTTAISFLSRPEKVVPGAPHAVQINFLGSDLTVTPVGSSPGNLLVYTRSGRYVILFRIGGDSLYDDVVKVSVGSSGKPIRLRTDAYSVVTYSASAQAYVEGRILGSNREIAVRESDAGREIAGPELEDLLIGGGPFRCKGCIVQTRMGGLRVSCARAIQEVRCTSKKGRLTLRRESP